MIARWQRNRQSRMMKANCTIKYRTLFGPVPARRLGISLGVDLVPHKTCSLDCVYCECGPTTHLTLKRSAYVPVDRVMAELKMYLAQNEKIDHITFSGSGEPTLNDGIGEIIHFLKTDFPRYKVALLTNSTLFDQADVRCQVRDADVVMASLDAPSHTLFTRINRPHPQLDLNAIVDGLAAFRKMYAGRLLVEYFAVKGVNDASQALRRMKALVERIDPDGVLLNTLDRPAAEAWVQPIGSNQLKAISDFFEDAEIVKYRSTVCDKGLRNEDMMARLVTTVRRRPYTIQDMSQIMGIDAEALQPVLDQLVASNQLTVKPMARGIFYMAL